MERKRYEEEQFIQRKIKSEERRLTKAQRQLESIRLLGELFKLAQVIVFLFFIVTLKFYVLVFSL